MSGSKYFLTMRFLDESYPELLDISSLLYDLELSHDYGVVLSEKEYQHYKFSRNFWYRNGRPIEGYHRVKAARIIKKSPLELTLVIASLGALWVLVQIIEKITNWPLNRKKLKLEVEKLEREIAEGKEANCITSLVHGQRKSREGAINVEGKLVQRLGESRLKLAEIEIKPFTEELVNDDRNGKG